MIGYHRKAMEFIKPFEGFNKNAVWDVNAWRIGYGSDTITFNNGSFRKVRQGDTTTEENASKDLKRRVPEFEKKVIDYLEQKGIAPKYWKRLPDPAKIGLLSFAYNYGNIVKNSIREAIKTGDVDLIASALITSTTNDMIGSPYYAGLLKRRKKEAELIRSQKRKIPLILKLGSSILGLLAIFELTKTK